MGDDIIQENVLPEKVESVFYHSFMSGLANRMRAWVTNSAFAEYLDVPCIMKWRSDDACGKTMFEDLFEIPDNMQYETGRRYQPDATTLRIKKNYPNNNFHGRFIENTIGLHIRRTDLKEQHKTPDVWFDQNIQNELKKNSNARFFLATDNKWTEEKFMMKYGDIMVKANRTFEENLEGGEAYPGGHRHRHGPLSEGLADMLLLGKTQKVYGCHGSSFGRFGAWFGGKKFIVSDYE